MMRALTLSLILIVALAERAAAEWHFTPMAGVTAFGHTSLIDIEEGTGRRHRQFGGAVTLLGAGWVGLEGLVVWTPGLFESDDVNFSANQELVKSTRSIAGMGNIVLTLPRRWTEYSLRPYLSGGLGVMHVAKEDIGIFLVNLNLPAFNIGAGAVGFFSERTGLRFDVRYHSTLRRTDHGPVALGPVHMRYVTASVGVVFRR
jgi:hypothetical protein